MPENHQKNMLRNSKRGALNRRTVPQENNGFTGDASLAMLVSVIGLSVSILTEANTAGAMKSIDS